MKHFLFSLLLCLGVYGQSQVTIVNNTNRPVPVTLMAGGSITITGAVTSVGLANTNNLSVFDTNVLNALTAGFAQALTVALNSSNHWNTASNQFNTNLLYQIALSNLLSGPLSVSPTNVVGTTNVTAAMVLSSTNLVIADADVPVVLGTSGTRFKSVTFLGYKDPRTVNAGAIFVQMQSDNGTNGVPIGPGLAWGYDAPANGYLTADQFWVDGAVADGVVALFTIY